MTKYDQILTDYERKLRKALQHLEYSYQKITKLPTDVQKLDEENLETWESFAARFSRVADLFLSKYLRTKILMQDPAFNGSLRDLLNNAEKAHLINDATYWMGIRELRNISVHEYSEAQLSQFFVTLKKEAPELIKIKNTINV